MKRFKNMSKRNMNLNRDTKKHLRPSKMRKITFFIMK